jgi:alkylhydroperoxidase family enzyme
MAVAPALRSALASSTQAGKTDERLFAVAAWRDAPSFNAAERAALALAEAVTRIADQADPVPDAEAIRQGAGVPKRKRERAHRI